MYLINLPVVTLKLSMIGRVVLAVSYAVDVFVDTVVTEHKTDRGTHLKSVSGVVQSYYKHNASAVVWKTSTITNW